MQGGESVERGRDDVIARYGPWTAHNVWLTDNVYTMRRQVEGDEFRLRRVVQIVSDLARRPIEELRILDLACLEGMYAIEFARRGATVLAIEGREANIEKARFAQKTLGLNRLEFVQDDVRNLSVGKHGLFDVVLCLGILYLLDSPDLFAFLERVAEVTTGFTIIATHIRPHPVERTEFRGHVYSGASFQEHEPQASNEDREKALWASLDNPRSFVLTSPSLFNALAHVGFTSAFRCRIPPEVIYEGEPPDDWGTFVAIKGERQLLLSAPLMNELPWEDAPEPPKARRGPREIGARMRGSLRDQVVRLAQRRTKRSA